MGGTINKPWSSFFPGHTFPFFIIVFLLLVNVPAFGEEEGWCPDSLPPPPRPQRRAGGESLAPLPLPVTPQRRTEKKRPPRPPALIGKIAQGKERDWLINRNDARNLLRWFEAKAGFKFGGRMVRLRKFSFDPADIPLLYLSGRHSFRWTESERAKIREYLIRGGSLIITNCCASKKFRQSARREIAALFPEKKLHPVGIDNPLYRSFYDITGDKYTRKAVSKPMVEGIDIGWRTVLIYSEYDLGCGWDPREPLETCPAYRKEHITDLWTRELGTNLLAYVLANRKTAQASFEFPVYVDKVKTEGNGFTIGQVIHAGQWDPDPSAISSLLKAVGDVTKVPVSLRNKNVELTGADLFSYPFLYLTGHNDFKLSKTEVKNLRFYLLNGGFLFADSADGREVFDAAFRREIRRVLPEFFLSPLPVNHPIYSAYYKIKKVDYSLAVETKDGNLIRPRLEGITVNGNLAVVYSPYDLRYGWNFNDHPYRKGYSPEDSLRLGVNVIVYALTH
ncbi:MAG: DUF4159 domain-containing protein [Nitrospirae bacterium]|nr:DUF4159 domain-containing protein [Nitrospirota bacterium]